MKNTGQYRKSRLILTVILALSMLFTLPVGTYATSPEGKTISASQITAEGGSSVDVPISISGNTGICGATISISYDTDLSLTKVTRGEALSGLDMTKPGNLSVNPVKVLWSGTEEDDSDGVIAVLTFLVPDRTGNYPVEIGIEDGDIMDGQYQPVDFNISNGGILVRDENQEAVQAVIDALEAFDPEDEDSVRAAREAYDALTDQQQALIDPELITKLTDAETLLEEQKVQQAIDNAISAINAINPGDRASVEYARTLYNALSDEQKLSVPAEVLKILTDAEEELGQEDAVTEADQNAANAVIEQINALDPNNKDSVEAAREAYDTLTDAQKALIGSDILKILENAEKAIRDNENNEIEDQNAADAVMETIRNMDTSDWESVDAARKAYDSLTDAQKALISSDILKILEDAESDIQETTTDINSLSFSELDSYVWDGLDFFPVSFGLLLKDDPWFIIEDFDYEIVSCTDTDKAGEGYAVVKGIGKYRGTKKFTFKINPLKMSGFGKSFCLSKAKYVYDGKVKTPTLKLKEEDELYPAYERPTKKDYTLKCSTNRKSVGKHTVQFVFKGNMSGSLKYSFVINPKGTALKKVKAGKMSFTATWKKQATQTTGYQIQYGLKKNFKGAKTVTVKKNKTVKYTVKKLKAKKKYYVRIRTYKQIGKTKYYSAWSKAKTVKTK